MSDTTAGEHRPSASGPHNDETSTGFDTVLVLDFGAQYGQLIARRVRECRVYSQLVPHDISIDEIKARRPKGLIFSGGPMSVYVDGAPRPDPRLYELGIPVLGICYGVQLMALQLGGTVAKTGVREFGKTQLRVVENGLLLDGLAEEEQCWMSHGDGIVGRARGVRHAGGDRQGARRRHGGPRARLSTPCSSTPRSSTRRAAWRCSRTSSTKPATARRPGPRASIIEEQVRRIREQVGPTDKAVLGLSGGVDSLGRRRARAQGHRRPPHLRLHRPGHDALERGRARGRDVRRAPAVSRSSHVDAKTAIPRQAGGRHRP